MLLLKNGNYIGFCAYGGSYLLRMVFRNTNRKEKRRVEIINGKKRKEEDACTTSDGMRHEYTT